MMGRTWVIAALLAAGCAGEQIPNTLGGQAKVLFKDSDGFVGRLDATLSADSPAREARQVHELDVYGDHALRWAGVADGQACFTNTVVQFGDKPHVDGALHFWEQPEFVVTTFDNREQLLAASWPAEGSGMHFTTEVKDVGLTGNNHYKIVVRMCGAATNVKDTAQYLAVILVPPKGAPRGTVWLWQVGQSKE